MHDHIDNLKILCYSICHQIELFHTGECFRDEYTMADVAYISGWERVCTLNTIECDHKLIEFLPDPLV